MPAALSLLEAARVAWMPADGALHGAYVDRLMFWNLIALCVCALAGHSGLRLQYGAVRGAGGSFSGDLSLGVVGRFLRDVCVDGADGAAACGRRTAIEGPSLTAMQVEVTGEQFQWYFRYPGADAAFGITRLNW